MHPREHVRFDLSRKPVTLSKAEGTPQRELPSMLTHPAEICQTVHLLQMAHQLHLQMVLADALGTVQTDLCSHLQQREPSSLACPKPDYDMTSLACAQLLHVCRCSWKTMAGF